MLASIHFAAAFFFFHNGFSEFAFKTIIFANRVKKLPRFCDPFHAGGLGALEPPRMGSKASAANVINSQTPLNSTKFKACHNHIQIFRRNFYLSNTQNTSWAFAESILITTLGSLNFGKTKSAVDSNFAGTGRKNQHAHFL